MKRFLVLIVLMLVGCGEPKPLSPVEIIEQVNASGKITGTLITRALNRRVMHL